MRVCKIGKVIIIKKFFLFLFVLLTFFGKIHNFLVIGLIPNILEYSRLFSCDLIPS